MVLRTLQISCDEVEYGFATMPANVEISSRAVLGMFHEDEGLTVVAPKEYFEAKGIAFEGPFAKLSIELHTSLALVGLTAVLAQKLAENGISANVVAAYYHDHIFVQYELRELATKALLDYE